MKKPGWAILTATQEKHGSPDDARNVAANEALQAELQKRGLPHAVVAGSYKGVDQGKNFLVTGVSEKTAQALGKKYGQESVLTNRGYVYQDGSVHPLDHKNTIVGPAAEEQDGYSVLPDGTPFSAGIDFSKKVQPDVRDTPAWKDIAPHLTDSERATMRADVAADLVAHFKSFPPDSHFEAASVMGNAKKGWYARAAQSLRSIFGPDTEKFVSLLAATSPRQSVQLNLEMAADVWHKWEEAGRPTDQATLKKLVDPAVGLEARSDNAVRALSGDHLPGKPVLKPAGGQLSGFKVENFQKNLLGDASAVTNDSWMAQFAGIDQKKFATKAGYTAMTAKVRRVAKTLDMQPAEVQETIWSFFKTLVEKSNVKTPSAAVLDALTENDIKATPEFATELLANPRIQAFLAARGRTPSGEAPAEHPAGAGTPKRLAGELLREGRSNKGVLSKLSARAQAIKDAELAGTPETPAEGETPF